MTKPYFEIGIADGKIRKNVGTLWRTAYQLNANGIFTVGARYRKQRCDTYNTSKQIPLRQFESEENFFASIPDGCSIVGIEMNGTPLSEFVHPKRAIYILGSEDTGIPETIIKNCQSVISLEAINRVSFNVAVAGSIVMYHRFQQFKEKEISRVSIP